VNKTQKESPKCDAMIEALGISGVGFLKEIQRENQHERPKYAQNVESHLPSKLLFSSNLQR
jgi:hypothetical protein